MLRCVGIGTEDRQLVQGHALRIIMAGIRSSVLRQATKVSTQHGITFT